MQDDEIHLLSNLTSGKKYFHALLPYRINFRGQKRMQKTCEVRLRGEEEKRRKIPKEMQE